MSRERRLETRGSFSRLFTCSINWSVLLAPSTGAVQVFGEPLAGINRRAGYMFQADSLMPWRTAPA